MLPYLELPIVNSYKLSFKRCEKVVYHKQQYLLLKEGRLGCVVFLLGEKIHKAFISKGLKENLHFDTFGSTFVE